MKRIKVVITIFVTLLLITNAVSRIKKEKERRKVPRLGNDSSNSITSINLCTIEGNAAPFHCFCSDGTATANATKAKCWIFNGLTQDHNLWALFSTQPLITDLNIMVTPMGQFTFIPTKGLQHLKNLQTLTILYGSIEEIHPYAFANLTKVSHLTLARNMIITLNHHAFAHLTNVSLIDLDENRISELSRDVFVDLPNLKKLFLKQNNISVIQENAFRQLGHLIELELSVNSVSVLTKDTFAGLGELKKLSLSYNKIVMLGDLTFAELWMLEELDLESNQIELISDRAFAGLTHLWRLNLSYNKLKNLRSTLLDGVPAIINFDLRHNSLETLTFDNVKPILHNFYNASGYFYLADNQFICDCRLAWMYILRNETKNQLIRDLLDELTCRMELDDDKALNPPPSPTKKQLNEDSFLKEREASLTPLNTDMSDTNYVEESSYYDDDGEDYQQQQSLQNQATASHTDDPSLRYLLQIALSELPCFDDSPTQAPRHFPNTPLNAEIKSNACSVTFSYSQVVISIFLAIVLSVT